VFRRLPLGRPGGSLQDSIAITWPGGLEDLLTGGQRRGAWPQPEGAPVKGLSRGHRLPVTLVGCHRVPRPWSARREDHAYGVALGLAPSPSSGEFPSVVRLSSSPSDPARRGRMASGMADSAAAMAVDRHGDGTGDILREEEIDSGLAALLSASWPTPDVADAKYERFPWAPLGGSLVERRYAAVDPRRMVLIWRTIRSLWGPLYAVPEGTETDFPFLRGVEDVRVCRVLTHLANRELPPVTEGPIIYSWEWYPGPPPKLGEEDRGFYVPTALWEWTIRNTLKVLALYEQREVREVPKEQLLGLYPACPTWWASVEVPRGMAARLPQMVGLQGGSLMEEPLGGAYHIMLATLWAVEVADVFVSSILFHGHLWRLPLALRSAFTSLTVERLCSTNPSVQPLLAAALTLLDQVEDYAAASWLEWEGTPRGVFRCAKSLNDDGVLVLLEGLGDPRLRYGRDVTPDLRLRLLDKEVADAGPPRYGHSVPDGLSPAGGRSQAPPLWGAVARPTWSYRGTPRYTRARRAYPSGGQGSSLQVGGHSGPPLAGLPLFTWDGSAQLGTPRAVSPAVWSGLGRSLGELPPILSNGVDHTLIMALSRTLVRLRNEVATVVSQPMGDREADRLYHMCTAETLRRILAEEYGAAVTEINTVMAGWSLRLMAGPAASAGGTISPATHQRPPSPVPPHYGGEYDSPSRVPYGARTGPSANPPTLSGPEYYTPAGPSRQHDGSRRSW